MEGVEMEEQAELGGAAVVLRRGERSRVVLEGGREQTASRLGTGEEEEEEKGEATIPAGSTMLVLSIFTTHFLTQPPKRTSSRRRTPRRRPLRQTSSALGPGISASARPSLSRARASRLLRATATRTMRRHLAQLAGLGVRGSLAVLRIRRTTTDACSLAVFSDPARDVGSFKKGTEQVLQRFIREAQEEQRA